MVTLIQCRDQVGLVAAIAGVMARYNINIVSMREYVDTSASRFFARVVTEQEADAGFLRQKLVASLPADAVVDLNPGRGKKIIVLVTKEYHCLGDILLRNHFKTLGATVQCVIGNHSVLQDLCDRFEIPFYYIANTKECVNKAEDSILKIAIKYSPDYLVLARYMRILSPQFVSSFPMRIINIHHSFLPAFTGASPYRQAYLRGVKLIGATAHFVNAGLDEGPIIEQQILPVNHAYTASDMVKAGREIEKAVLNRALELVFGDRVFVYNGKTIVFDQV